MKELLDLWKRCPECSPKDLSWVESFQGFRMDFDGHGIDWEIMPDDHALAIACDHLERWLISRGFVLRFTRVADVGDHVEVATKIPNGEPRGRWREKIVYSTPGWNDRVKTKQLISAVNAVLDREEAK